VAGDWRRPHNEELHNLYASPNIIKEMKSRTSRRAGNVARMGEVRNGQNILVGEPDSKTPFGTRRPPLI
jgi:hypothetical protein